MAILIDPPEWPAHGTLWSHLVSDTGYDELHAFAARLGAPRRGFDLDHYDVPAALYEQAIRLGAQPVSAKDVVHRLRDAGLRVRQTERATVTPLRRGQYLRDEWSLLGGLLGIARPEHEWHRLGEDLLGRWNEPHRSYHDERHLEDVLLALNHLATRGELIAPATLAAAWFHDAIYEGAGSDELDSARLATSALGGFGLDPGFLGLVGQLIVETTPGRAAEARDADPVAAHLLDADLAIFAASEHRYGEYSAAVRAEYAHIPAAEFADGRARILSGYLERATIYRSEAGILLWERAARANLERELEALLGEPDRILPEGLG